MKTILILICIFIFASCGESPKANPEARFRVLEKGKFGYIDGKGRMAISPRFESAGRFSDGLAAVMLNWKWVYIDKTGAVVIHPQTTDGLISRLKPDGPVETPIKSFSEGMAAIYRGPDWVYVDPVGKVIEPGDKVGGMTMVWQVQQGSGQVIATQPDGGSNPAAPFSEGLAAVKISDLWGYIDKTGKVVIKSQFDDAGRFREGLAPVMLKDKKAGFIDQSGKFVITAQFDLAKPFAEALAPIKQEKKWGYIDKTGKIVIKSQFDDAYPFAEGLALVQVNSKWGFVDRSGRFAINATFDDAYTFSQGYAQVEINKKFGYIDKKGALAITPRFEAATDFVDGLAEVRDASKRHYIDQVGRTVWEESK